eukprot:scaffold50618_cov30-Prasinocladus_malaysianus.AAC.1
MYAIARHNKRMFMQSCKKWPDWQHSSPNFELTFEERSDAMRHTAIKLLRWTSHTRWLFV